MTRTWNEKHGGGGEYEGFWSDALTRAGFHIGDSTLVQKVHTLVKYVL